MKTENNPFEESTCCKDIRIKRIEVNGCVLFRVIFLRVTYHQKKARNPALVQNKASLKAVLRLGAVYEILIDTN